MKLEYFKTDKNGTTYYHDWTCPRCGGLGASDRWRFTGCTCYECGGTGKRSRPKIVKEYTPEYQEKLDMRRKAKIQANEPTEAEKAEIQKAHEETKSRSLAWECKQFGCDAKGKGFVYMGNTYKYKDDFRAVGGRWINLHRCWITPTLIPVDESIKVIEIDIAGLLEYAHGCWHNHCKVHALLDDLKCGGEI